MIEYIYEGKPVYRTDRVIPRVEENVYLRERMYKVSKVVYILEKKIIQVHLL